MSNSRCTISVNQVSIKNKVSFKITIGRVIDQNYDFNQMVILIK
jgi:hypothetical protein